MDFGWALHAMRAGALVTRRHWGDASWVVLRNGYPDGIRVDAHTQHELDVEDGAVLRFPPYLAMVTRVGQVFPWTASDDSLLADDWELLGSGGERD